MPADAAVRVRNLRQIQAAVARADKRSRTVVRGEFRQLAEPIRHEAETLASSQIRRMPVSPKWAKMRTGITRTLVYVAPRQRGVKTRGPDPRRRPNLADLLMKRAMEPALDHHAAQIERDLEQAFERIADEFNGGGGAL